MKLTEKQEKEHLINILSGLLNTNIELMKLYKEIAVDTKGVKSCEKSIKQSRTGLKRIREIEHIEILRSLYKHLISGNETYFTLSGSLCSYERIKTWDTTDSGYQEFIELEQKGDKETIEHQEKLKKNQEIIAQAKAEGKKVEMIYDKDTKEMRPVVIDTPNA